jgi:SAM-dependent methyltransferase
MARNTIRRKLLRRVPILKKLAIALDNLEDQNKELKDQLDQVLVLENHSQSDSSNLTKVDGTPVPTGILRYWVAGTEDMNWFLKSGEKGVQAITDVLFKNNMQLGQFDSILDFGCGCGRVIRHLKKYDNIKLHGSDCNEKAIRWCDENLYFAEFSTNLMDPPTRYSRHSFDLIYAFSVFTHFPGYLQTSWLKELHRILKPNGYLIVSLHGDYYLQNMSEPEKKDYEEGNFVVLRSDKTGQNSCMAYHPQKYVRNVFIKDKFEIVDFVPQGALGNPEQDLYLLKSLVS